MMRWLVIATFALGACAGAPRPTYTATFTDRSIRIGSYIKSFRAAEPSMIEAVALDTRLFARMHPRPQDLDGPFGAPWIERPFVDPFSFTDREAALTRGRAQLERVSLPPALQAEMLDPVFRPADIPELAPVRLEQQAYQRLLDAEDDRLERERTLPRGAADLLRAMKIAWPLAPGPGAIHDLESMVAWRLQNLEQSLAPNSLSTAERDDAEIALADLAPLVAPLPHAAAAMAKLRAALEAMWTSPYALEDEATLDRELEIYVGSPMSFDALDGAFATATRALDVQIDAGFSVLGEVPRERVRARARALLFGAPTCEARMPVRTPLDLAPPDERAWSCALMHALGEARGDEDELAADLALRDAVVVARWSVSTHGPVRAKDAALRLASLEAGESPAEIATLVRLACARPMRAIAAGVAASVLTARGGAHVRARAQKWRAIGDAPIDLVAPLLGPQKN